MPLPDRVAFTAFGLPIYWYGLMIMSGLLAGGLLAAVREKRVGLKKDTAVDFMLLCIPLALIGARVYYVAFEWKQYAADPIQIFNVRHGGIAIYGAILGGALAGVIFARWRKIPFSKLADLSAPALVIGQAIGRWGNFFNQEAYGGVVESASRQFFPLAVYIEATGQWHYATFFYESAWCFLVCAILLFGEWRKAFYKPGDLFLWYAILYAAERVLVEGLRTDSLWWGPIRVSQMLSLAVLVAGLVWTFLRAWRARRGWFPIMYMILGALAAAWFVATMINGASGSMALSPVAAIAVLSGGSAMLYAISRPAPAEQTNPLESGRNE